MNEEVTITMRWLEWSDVLVDLGWVRASIELEAGSMTLTDLLLKAGVVT